MSEFTIDHAIQNPEGDFYTGNTSPGIMWTSDVSQAFIYTYEHGCIKRDAFPFFKNCEVVWLGADK